MLTRVLGRSGIEVSGLGLGCYPIGGPFWRGDHDSVSWQTDRSKQFPGGWGRVDDAESIRAIHAGLDLGVNFLDTSESYGCGHSERVIGRAIAGRREKVVIGTKFGNLIDEKRKLFLGHDASPEFIRQCCENSLARLATDYIDVYYLHWGNFEGELEPILETLEELIHEGKIRTYGWSTDSAEAMRRFAEGEHCGAVEYALHVARRNAAMDSLCEELDLGAVIRGPLGMGLLTGKYDVGATFPEDDIRHGWDLTEGRLGAIREALNSVKEILASGGRTLAQGALAWIWAHSDRAVPIPGFRTVAQVTENAKAMELGPLSGSDVEEIERLLEAR